jgi:hypothetical protein
MLGARSHPASMCNPGCRCTQEPGREPGALGPRVYSGPVGASESAAADGRGDPKALFDCFRSIGKFKPRPLPLVLDQACEPLGDSCRRAAALQAHLDSLMRGRVQTRDVDVPAAGFARGISRLLAPTLRQVSDISPKCTTARRTARTLSQPICWRPLPTNLLAYFSR